MLSTTAWDPAPVCTRWWSSACWCGSEPAWNWLLPCMKGLMCDTPHQHVFLQHIPAEVMQLVHSCGLPKELSYQRKLCSLSIAAACQKSCHTSRLLPSGAKSWQMSTSPAQEQFGHNLNAICSRLPSRS